MTNNKFHLIFLVHGNHGHSNDMIHFENSILLKFTEESMPLKIISSISNEKDTEIGIKIGGNNLAKEIIDAVNNINPKNDDQIMFSIIAHSLGGLFARQSLINVFKDEKCIKHLCPISFITLNSPHLGVRRASGNIFQNFIRYSVHGICHYLYKQTGADLMLNNNVLMELAEDDNLCKFKYVTIVGLNNYDIAVPLSTSLLLPRYQCFNNNNVSKYSNSLTLDKSYGFNDEYLKLNMYDKYLSSEKEIYNKSIFDYEESIINSEKPAFVTDNLNQIEYSQKMFQILVKKNINWRKIFLECGSIYTPVAHNMTIKKGDKIFGYVFDPIGCDQFINLVTNILFLDHQIF